MLSKIRLLLTNKETLQTLFRCFSLAFLFTVTFFGAYIANLSNITNADHLIYPFLFKDFQLDNIIVPADHSNILKYPLFILQGVLPYNNVTVSVVNIGISLFTVILWALLLAYVFGKKYLPIICMTLSVVIVGSVLLNHEILGVTIRNIEYPIALTFIIMTISLLKSDSFLKKTHVFGLSIVSLLMALSLAGDNLLLYGIVVPLGLTLLITLFTKYTTLRRSLMALGLIMATLLASVIIRKSLEYIGVVELFKEKTHELTVTTYQQIAPSFNEAVHQTITLFGGDIFNKPISSGIFISFFCLGLLALSLIGGMYFIKDTLGTHMTRQKLILITLLFSSFLIFWVYILLDLVVSQISVGVYASKGQDRYLTLLPFIAIAFAVYLLKHYLEANKHIDARKILINVSVLLSIVSIIGSVSLLNDRIDTYTYNGKIIKNNVNRIVEELENRGVKTIVAGYWYAVPTAFNAKTDISFASIGNCNHQNPTYNIRKSFYIPDDSRSAIIVDTVGPDKIYWPCSQKQIENIYGIPAESVAIANGVDLYIYNYDVRSKIKLN